MTMPDLAPRRQALYWRLLSTLISANHEAANLDNLAQAIAADLNLPPALLDPRISIEHLLQRYPELEPDFTQPLLAAQGKDDLAASDRPPATPSFQPDRGEVDGALDLGDDRPSPEPPQASLRRALVISKLLLNALGPNTQTPNISAAQYAQWLQDVRYLEQALGYPPGSLRQGMGGAGAGQGSGQGAGAGAGGSPGKGAGAGSGTGGEGAGTGLGTGFTVTDEQLRATLKALEGDLVKRMALREVLSDDRLAQQLSPSMPLVEQLLRDKANLSGTALRNAKALIQQYVQELAEVLRLQVVQAVAGKIDYSVPPKRVFRNLDLKRTLWKNLTNWDPQQRRLLVDRLYFKHSAKKKTPTRLIVVVDQSGSMVDAMVQCTILASIFAGLPLVDVHLLAFDTRVLNLTPWVNDPFEVLLRTQLGGGTYIYQALLEAAQLVESPRNTAVVLISDFYEGGSDQVLFDYIKSLKDSGVHFIPVGAMTSSGYFSVNQWFRTKLKDLGTPILAGAPQKLIQELKALIVV